MQKLKICKSGDGSSIWRFQIFKNCFECDKHLGLGALPRHSLAFSTHSFISQSESVSFSTLLQCANFELLDIERGGRAACAEPRRAESAWAFNIKGGVTGVTFANRALRAANDE